LDLRAAGHIVISPDISVMSHGIIIRVIIGRVGVPVQALNLLRNAAYGQLMIDGFVVTVQQAIGLSR
jgi:hypothetical protein